MMINLYEHYTISVCWLAGLAGLDFVRRTDFGPVYYTISNEGVCGRASSSSKQRPIRTNNLSARTGECDAMRFANITHECNLLANIADDDSYWVHARTPT